VPARDSECVLRLWMCSWISLVTWKGVMAHMHRDTCDTMVCVCHTSTLHAPRWCILPRIKVKKSACTLFQASPHHVLRSPPILSPAQWRAPGKEDKDTLLAAYSSDHHAPKHSRWQTCAEHAQLTSCRIRTFQSPAARTPYLQIQMGQPHLPFPIASGWS